jgi:hypothetical protein
MTELPDPATGPEQAAERSDLRELVWKAAAGLSERDRALLDLHLRHGLEGAELGEAMGVEPGLAHVLLSRPRDQVERSLGALLVARLGRDDCPDLAGVLADWDGRFSALIRKRVASTSTAAKYAASHAAPRPAPSPCWPPSPPCRPRPPCEGGSCNGSSSREVLVRAPAARVRAPGTRPRAHRARGDPALGWRPPRGGAYPRRRFARIRYPQG